MQESGISFGVVEKGKTVVLTFQQSDDWTPSTFDVIDPATGLAVIEDEALVQYTGQLDDLMWFASIDTDLEDTNGDLFTAGKTYAVRVRGWQTEANTAPDQITGNLTVLPGLGDKLTRILGMLGENVMLDVFTYDNAAGNITGYRMRVFEDATSAEAATKDATGFEPGEIAQFDVTQTHDFPRSLRTMHLSVLENKTTPE